MTTRTPIKASKAALTTRRGVLRATSGILAAAAMSSLRPLASAAQLKPDGTPEVAADITGQLARYMVEAGRQTLPGPVLREAKIHILDTLGAMISGARLKPGEMAIRYVRAQGGVSEASVFTTNLKTSAANCALAHGMFAHADETDDFEPVTKAHPGCSVVPAALAVAEREGRSGLDLLRGVTLGYDLGCRLLMALGPDLVRATHRSAEGMSATFGAAVAAASLAGLDELGMQYALSYASQQVSGIWSWVRDADHVEKAFDFGGMGARNGVTAALMVQAGFTGVRNVLDGENNPLQALSTQPKPAEIIAGLGSRFFVTETAIKRFPVGYPIQAPLDALLTLRKENNLTPDNVLQIVVRLPEDGASIVDNSAMPDVNCQHIMAVALVDGTVSFVEGNSRERMKDPRVLAVRQRVKLIGDRQLMDPEAPRSGQVEVTLKDGKTVSHFTKYPPGTKENPLDGASMNEKVRDLMAPVLGADRTEAVIRQVNALEELDNVRKLCGMLTA
jgi:2-methylcitrate dehydratase PrpD